MKRILLLLWLLIAFIGCSGREKKETTYPNGQVKERYYTIYIAPEKIAMDGKYDSWNEVGQERSTGEYSKGAKQGHWIEWVKKDNGNRIMNIPITAKWEERSEGDYVDDTKTGRWTYSVNDKIRSEGEYLHNHKQGHWAEWSEDGKKLDDRDYTDNGRLCHIVYWYPNGKKQSEGVLSEDYYWEGHWISWYENGVKSWENDYVRGSPQGPSMRWNEDGQKVN